MSPRSREQFDKLRAKSRQAIMASALELFTHHGYHGTSVSMIAEQAGVSTGLMYNYFKSKQELLEAIIHEGIELIESTLAALDTIDDPNLQIERIVHEAFNMVDEDMHFWTLYFSVLMQPDLPKSAREIFSNFIQRIFSVLEDVFRRLGYPNPKAEARILGAMLDGAILHYWLVEKNYPLEDVKNLIIQKYTAAKQTK